MAQIATINPLNQFFALDGSPLNNGKLYFGDINTDPEQNPVQMYWDEAGLVPALQPIRTTSGYPSRSGSPAILYGAVAYSLRVRQSNDVQVFYLPRAGSAGAVSGQWFDTTLVPSYISATSFSLAGDQTEEFQVGRRIKTTNTGGTIYSTITASVFGSVTTITVVNDSGVLDSGLSQVSYGIISASNISTPSPITLNAPIVTTSGTAQNQTGIPRWAKRVTVNVLGVSVSGTDTIQIRLGTASGVETSGYVGSTGAVIDPSVAASSSVALLSSGFSFARTGSAGQIYHGRIVFDLANATTNTWTCSGVLGRTDAEIIHLLGGSKPLVAALDRIQITTSLGVNTFDAGSISVSWE